MTRPVCLRPEITPRHVCLVIPVRSGNCQSVHAAAVRRRARLCRPLQALTVSAGTSGSRLSGGDQFHPYRLPPTTGFPGSVMGDPTSVGMSMPPPAAGVGGVGGPTHRPSAPLNNHLHNHVSSAASAQHQQQRQRHQQQQQQQRLYNTHSPQVTLDTPTYLCT